MAKYILYIILPVILAITGCDKFGQVDQGRVVSFDQNEKTILIVRDKSEDPKKIDYSGLPPVSYKLPDDPAETGPEPTAGKLLKIDRDKNEVIIFDEKSNNILSIKYAPIEQKKADPETQKNTEFPMIKQTEKNITLYLEKEKMLLTFSVPDEYFSLPKETWIMGDEVRVYYKEPGKSLRYMNISKTDIFKK